MVIISWIWAPLIGFLSIVFLVLAWGGLFGTIFAIIGMVRKRARWWAVPLYFSLSVIFSVLFRAVFWLSDRVMTSDVISTGLVWGTIIITGLGALFEMPKLLKELWKLTNQAEEN